VRYLGIEVDNASKIAEQTGVWKRGCLHNDISALVFLCIGSVTRLAVGSRCHEGEVKRAVGPSRDARGPR